MLPSTCCLRHTPHCTLISWRRTQGWRVKSQCTDVNCLADSSHTACHLSLPPVLACVRLREQASFLCVLPPPLASLSNGSGGTHTLCLYTRRSVLLVAPSCITLPSVNTSAFIRACPACSQTHAGGLARGLCNFTGSTCSIFAGCCPQGQSQWLLLVAC
jgi:hypothetical protein